MKRVGYELRQMSGFLNWLITHACEQSKRKGDGWDCIADDLTDARENIKNALKVTEGEVGK